MPHEGTAHILSFCVMRRYYQMEKAELVIVRNRQWGSGRHERDDEENSGFCEI